MNKNKFAYNLEIIGFAILPSTTGDLECLLSSGGEEYVGTHSVTINGTQCAPWVEHLADDDFPEGSKVDAKNYCRNPDGDVGPWCPIEDDDWELCSIPMCGE